jgi:hypothetical protein
MFTTLVRRVALPTLLVLLASPVASFAQAPGERSALPPQDCDRACLMGYVHDYMSALARRSTAGLKLAPGVRYTENNVEMPLGKEGIWATATGVAPTGLEAADVQRGEAAWIGAVDEHGAPVYFGLRLKVQDRLITEVESVVVRNSGLPLPWGDFSRLVHDPAFGEVLPEESRRPRERLRAVADSYFNTVELNDGVVFAPFHADCARIENGIITTRATALSGPGGGDASSISPGCEAQFKLGIYRINKRIRERRYPIIDEERGVVVATGFFDHANGFDRYKLTDGREMRTALKWPNSISLVEAFKIVDGRIYRIETVFSYVPYFMPSPYYLHPVPPAAPKAPVAGRAAVCDEACLLGIGDRFMDALAARTPGSIPWAATVRYSENGVPMAIGDGLWASIRNKAPQGLRIADATTGSFAWYGLVYDHDAPAYAGLRLKVEGGRIAEVEAVVARERNPGPWLAPAQFAQDAAFAQELPAGERASRRQLVAAVEGYARTMERNDGKLFARFDAACARRENGQVVTQAGGASAVIARNAGELAQGCEAQLKLGLYRPLEQLRNRRYPVVDPVRGLVVAQSIADFPMRDTKYTTSDGRALTTSANFPVSRELFEVLRVRGGRIEKVDAVSVFQPYHMASPWVAVEPRR